MLLVQVTPSRDSFVPITAAAIDRRLDQIAANAVLNAELSALELSGNTRCAVVHGSPPKTRSMGSPSAARPISAVGS